MFKHKLAFASLLVLSGCGVSREALMALEDMQILENNTKPGLSYTSLSGSGNDVTLKGVELRAPRSMAVLLEAPADSDSAAPATPAPENPGASEIDLVARAETMTLKGLTIKDGKPTVRDIRFDNITPVLPAVDMADGVTASLATIRLEGMNEATGTFIAGAMAQDETLEPPPFEQWAFSKAELGGFKLAGAIPQDEGKTGSFSLELGELSFGNLAAARLGDMKLAGLKGAVDIPGMPNIAGTFDFGTLTASAINAGFVAKSFMAGFQAELNPDEPVDYAEIYRDLTSPLDGGIDRIDWTGMTADVSGLKFDTSEMHAKVTRNADGVVVASDLPRTSFKLTADASGGTMGAMGVMGLAMAGYDSNVIDIYASMGATFDPAKDLTRWTDYNVGVTDLFDVKMSGGVIGLKQALPSLMNGLMAATDMVSDQMEDEGFDEESDDESSDGEDGDDDAPPEDSAGEDDADAQDDAFGGASPEMMMSLMMGILPLQLTDLDISVTDSRLMSLILNAQAMESGQDAAALRADLVAMIGASSTFLADAGVDAAIASELTAATSAFMAGPGTLRIQLKPKTPLGVMTAMAAPLTKESLGFSASFTPMAPAVN